MLILLVTALAGCGTSPPTQFVTLDVRPPTSAVAHVVGTPISVGRVTLPPTLDRPALVRQINPNRVAVEDLVQWAGPLDVMVRQTLAMDLAARLPRGMVILPGQPKSSGAQRLVIVTIENFWANEANEVTLQAHWSLVAPEENDAANLPPMNRQADIKISAASAKPGDIAGAMSEALGQLADQIAKGATEEHQ